MYSRRRPNYEPKSKISHSYWRSSWICQWIPYSHPEPLTRLLGFTPASSHACWWKPNPTLDENSWLGWSRKIFRSAIEIFVLSYMFRLRQSPNNFTWQLLGLPKTCWLAQDTGLYSETQWMYAWLLQSTPNYFSGNSGLPMDVESAWVAFNSMFVNELNWDLSLLVKRTRMGWKTLYSILSLVNKLIHTLRGFNYKEDHFCP